MKNKIDYTKVGDKELGILVTIKFYNCSKWSFADDESTFYHCGIDGSGYYQIPVIDINSWADMGPIITDNLIAISPLIDDLWAGEWVACIPYHVDSTYIHYDDDEAAIDKNPLRAAAIVYLMMSDEDEE